jgi:hypothetical protein
MIATRITAEKAAPLVYDTEAELLPKSLLLLSRYCTPLCNCKTKVRQKPLRFTHQCNDLKK